MEEEIKTMESSRNPGNPKFGKIESESGGTSSFRKKEGRIPREANFGRPIKPPSYTIANSMGNVKILSSTYMFFKS